MHSAVTAVCRRRRRSSIFARLPARAAKSCSAPRGEEQRCSERRKATNFKAYEDREMREAIRIAESFTPRLPLKSGVSIAFLSMLKNLSKRNLQVVKSEQGRSRPERFGFDYQAIGAGCQ